MSTDTDPLYRAYRKVLTKFFCDDIATLVIRFLGKYRYCSKCRKNQLASDFGSVGWETVQGKKKIYRTCWFCRENQLLARFQSVVRAECNVAHNYRLPLETHKFKVSNHFSQYYVFREIKKNLLPSEIYISNINNRKKVSTKYYYVSLVV
jgi:hypothetical protein